MNDATRKLNPQLDLGPSMLATRAADPNFASVLDEHERNARTNRKNDGRGFENEIERTIGAYQSRREATLRKVSPPARIVGGKFDRRVIFLANPFLDYVGSWTARNGRAIFIEAKSTASHLLRFKASGGITEDQWVSIRTWRNAGAAVAVLWQYNGKCVLILPETLLAAEASGARSLAFESQRPVPRGTGSVIWDFLPVLAGAIWPVPPVCST